jgi:hypothetical protein
MSDNSEMDDEEMQIDGYEEEEEVENENEYEENEDDNEDDILKIATPKGGDHKPQTSIPSELEDAYVLRNGIAYKVPLSNNRESPGRVRDYAHPVVVDNDFILGSMHQVKSWPRSSEISASQIVVIKAKHTDGEEIDNTHRPGQYEWYARVITQEDECGDRVSENFKILKPLPPPLINGLYKRFKDDPEYSNSTLITIYYDDIQKKAFPVDVNEWERVVGVKSTGISQSLKKVKDDTEAKIDAPQYTSPGTSDNHSTKNQPKVKFTEDLKHENKDRKTVGMLNFTKVSTVKKNINDFTEKLPKHESSNNQIKDKSLKNGGNDNKSESGNNKQELDDKQDNKKGLKDKHVKHKSFESKQEFEKSIMENSTAENPAVEKPNKKRSNEETESEYKFKRVRKIEVDDPSSTSTVWKGNVLYIIEI